ncbi:MAG: crossover junction endodeoxyribonuclease RuvC [Candidatus Moranbacteria bacterium CG_4_10_14_3_um_filter_44_15]|nr:MAG: crossover junction endodeoxyribonuclease RuvC [Candidatus Moranbacteria bacterium CG06_land_8_20_14_3_00_43_56]PIV83573.1 MAG: crossover junction endodeoxyribonuclease RuvC [Candidatus Moranbacteria bacterium CG17_big_fil_post_rev_8_21_14_2_50_44_12]PIX91038.1 MAG: crossover junction endodeoxyribonuclease RuvC [Candidatus Moranbacteria bacterium CG_4_10_14_3_um_filter_44_15]PJA86095.1 MAG: crossover junction endodeoxyribonuclease RuvC [Candidatus Moranbacteria bacterium CG_4_9_14_3_um_fi
MKILGIDPGTAITGWAVVEEKKGEPRLIACGCINTSKLKSDADRLVEIGEDIATLIKKHKPREVAVEDLFFFKNLKTAITVAQSRGVILYKIKKNKLPLFSYTPLQVKQALTGYGRADKRQIQIMVKNVLKLKNTLKPDDAADATAIAICHINSRRFPKTKS